MKLNSLPVFACDGCPLSGLGINGDEKKKKCCKKYKHGKRCKKCPKRKDNE